MLSVSGWLSPQAFPFSFTTITMIFNIPLFNILGGETWLSRSHKRPFSSSTNLTVSDSPFCCSQECAKATVDAVSTNLSVLPPTSVSGKMIRFVWYRKLSLLCE